MTTSVHWRTPNLTVIDSRGLSIRQVAYLRKVAADPASAREYMLRSSMIASMRRAAEIE